MASQKDQIINAERLNNLKNLVREECKKRKYNVTLNYGTHSGTQLSITGGSVEEYGGSNWNYTNVPSSNKDALTEHFNKISVPLRAININKVPEGPSDRVINDKDLTNLETTIAAFRLREIEDTNPTDCFTLCTGTCTTTCTGGCTNGCTNKCQGCGSSCSYNCSGSCSGDACAKDCTSVCSSQCSGECGSGCIGDCWTVCSGSNCSTTCRAANADSQSQCTDGACATTCSGNCWSGCAGGCGADCSSATTSGACGNNCAKYT